MYINAVIYIYAHKKWTEILTKRNASNGRLSIVDYNARFVNKLNGENVLHLIAKTDFNSNISVDEEKIISICKWLLDEQGLSLIQNKDGNTAIHFAIETNKLKLALYFAKRFQAKNVVNLKNNNNISPIQMLQEKSEKENDDNLINGKERNVCTYNIRTSIL